MREASLTDTVSVNGYRDTRKPLNINGLLGWILCESAVKLHRSEAHFIENTEDFAHVSGDVLPVGAAWVTHLHRSFGSAHFGRASAV